MRAPYIVIIALLLAASALAQTPGAAPPYRVVVNAKSAVGSVERTFLADVFLKKVVRWPNGEAILPVDLDAGSGVRRRFSDEVLGRPLAAVRLYWQQQIFSGRNIPPPELESDAAVVEFVAKHKGAVGYVSGSAAIDGVKTVSLR
jgi:ABC-type phosphate transport system substrate-binding protein